MPPPPTPPNSHTHAHTHLHTCLYAQTAMMFEFGWRWYLVGIVTFDRPLHGKKGRPWLQGGWWVVVRGVGGAGYRDRARTACSVVVSSTEASLYWPYIGAAVRALGTPCCDCITAAPELHPSHMRGSKLEPLHLTRPKHFGHLTSISLMNPPLPASHDTNNAVHLNPVLRQSPLKKNQSS